MFRKYLLLIGMVLVLAACENTGETIVICELDHVVIPGFGIEVGSMTHTLEAVDGYILIHEEVTRFELESHLNLLNVDTVEDAVQFWEMSVTNPDLIIPGRTAELYDVTDTHLILRVVMDYEEMICEDFDELCLESELDLATQDMEGQGAVCSVQ